MKEIAEFGTPIGMSPAEILSRRQGRTLKKNISLIDTWLMAKRLEGCSEQTLAGYQLALYRFTYIMEKKITDITTAEIRHYMMEYQEKRQCSNAQMDNIRRYLSSFYSFLENELYIDASPMRRIKKIKQPKVVRYPFTDEELVRMEMVCESLRDRALISFLTSTGVRVGELCALTKNDLDMQNLEAVVYGKGSKEREIYFDARTKVLLQDYFNSRDDTCPAVFVGDAEPHDALKKTGVEAIIRRIGASANVDKCYPHRFRRTFATRLLNRGMPIEQVQRLLGHSKIETTLIYASVNQENVKVSYRKFQ